MIAGGRLILRPQICLATITTGCARRGCWRRTGAEEYRTPDRRRKLVKLELMLELAHHLLRARYKRLTATHSFVPGGYALRFEPVELGRKRVAHNSHDLVQRNVNGLGNHRQVFKVSQLGIASDVVKLC